MEGSAIPRGGAPRIAVDRPPAYPENLCDVSTPHRSVAAPRRSRSRGSGSTRAPHGVPANDVCASRPSHRIGIARFSPLRTGLDSTGPGSSPRSRLAIALVNTGVDIIVGGPFLLRLDPLQPQRDHERGRISRQHCDPRTRPEDDLHEVRSPRRRRAAGLVAARQ